VRRIDVVRIGVATVVACAALLPDATNAQEPNPAETERRLNEVRAQRGQVNLQVDALTARDAQVRAAIDRLEVNLATQKAELDEAERALADAEAEVVMAAADVAAAEAHIRTLNVEADALVVDAFVNPASDNALDAFRADTLSDATIQQALIGIQAESTADVLDQLEQAHEDLEVEKANKEELAAIAEDRRATAESELAEVRNALDQQEQFAAEVEERLNAKLAEAESLRAVDAALADRLMREQAEIARRIRAAQAAAAARAAAEAAARAAAAAASGGGGGGGGSGGGSGGGGGGSGPSIIQPAPGGLATVSCPFGGSITVAGSIAGNVQGLLDRARAQGVSICGSGWRSPQRQIELRQQHCGTSTYAVYEMPSSLCNPPTARPGSSMHERGLAIDFTCNGGGAIIRGNSCWNFLAGNANAFGLYNLPSEPWHWSTNGN
jgi:hypothetical protein